MSVLPSFAGATFCQLFSLTMARSAKLPDLSVELAAAAGFCQLFSATGVRGEGWRTDSFEAATVADFCRGLVTGALGVEGMNSGMS